MAVTRRHLAAVGALAFGATALLRNTPSLADTADEAAVNKAREELRVAQLKQDKAKLEGLLADKVSYGHWDGRVEDKAKAINGIMTRKAVLKSLDFSELTVAVVGNTAIARHHRVSESELDGKSISDKRGVLQVWQKQDGNWKLWARQAVKLA